ncbi:MAG: hypothetical protein Q8J78_17685 [Moraxellaceae bacterium]|nr:hypothetical protein [Moraxellaceae bacterium]
MVGLDKFQQHFAAFADQYVLIGGVATLLALEEQGLEARATKDLDIVLCVEVLNPAFVQAFWAFVKAGSYQIQQRSSGKKVFHRFSKPATPGYPAMLEIFSRQPDGVSLGKDAQLTHIPVDEDVSSLSAILLDDDYYAFLHANKHELVGVQVANEYCLIPLKARAWLDLSRRKTEGEATDQKNITKHRSDVLRLYQLLDPERRLILPSAMAADMAAFLEALGSQDDQLLKSVGIKGLSLAQVVETLNRIYGLTIR